MYVHETEKQPSVDPRRDVCRIPAALHTSARYTLKMRESGDTYKPFNRIEHIIYEHPLPLIHAIYLPRKSGYMIPVSP
jgi:hypothetical protein